MLLEIGRPFDAVKAAEEACLSNASWGASRWTLARAQLEYGEAAFALKSFEEAVPLLLDAGEDAHAQECADEANRAETILTIGSIRQAMRDVGIAPPPTLTLFSPQDEVASASLTVIAPNVAGRYDPLDLSQQVYDPR